MNVQHIFHDVSREELPDVIHAMGECTVKELGNGCFTVATGFTEDDPTWSATQFTHLAEVQTGRRAKEKT